MNSITTLVTLILLPLFTFFSNAQPCPGFQSGNPSNHLQEVKFYDAAGNLLATCNCQLTGNAFKCGNCVPAGFVTYQFMYSGVVVNCVNGSVLPVELSNWNAVVTQSEVQLSWTTQSERDNAYFVVERSENGGNFEAIAMVKGDLNSTTALDYQITDYTPLKGTSYYRLKQMDVNGTETISGLVSVEFNPKALQLQLYPNPASGQVHVRLPELTGALYFQVRIADQTGKCVWEAEVKDEVTITLPAGYYLVQASSGSTLQSASLVVF